MKPEAGSLRISIKLTAFNQIDQKKKRQFFNVRMR